MSVKRYLVGGAVRDQLLGLPVHEHDWLVAGSSAEALLAAGYQQVGRHFPVFLHPQTHEEHALPRGTGGDSDQAEVSLEDDLRRRDLTINAMAMDEDGTLIDPCNGQADLQQRLLRHMPSFRDDPVRLLRVARFAARMQPLGFRVAAETAELLRRMVDEGDLQDIPPERVFSEFQRALAEDHPRRFIEELRACGALAALLPEVDRLFGVPQPAQYHPEIDTGEHTLMVLQQACRLSQQPATRMAALLHDVGKGTTPPSQWPRHIAHEQRGVALIRELAQRLRLPNEWRELALAVSRHHLQVHRALELKPATLLRLLHATDALRRPQRFEQFLLACEADARGRLGREDSDYPQAHLLAGALACVQALDSAAIAATCKDPQQVPDALRRERTRAIAAYRQVFANAESA